MKSNTNHQVTKTQRILLFSSLCLCAFVVSSFAQEADWTELRTLTGHLGAVYSVAFSPDGQILASGSRDNTIKLWRVADGSLLRTLTGTSDNVWSVMFSPDGECLAGGSYQEIVIWRVSDGSRIRNLIGHSGSIKAVTFSPDGALLASGSDDKSIRLWRVSDGSYIRKLIGHSGPINAVSFSPDGETLVSGSADHTVRIWRVSDGSLIRTLKGHSYWVMSVAFSPDGGTLASGSRDNTIKLWRVLDGGVVGTLIGHSGFVYSVAFSPDGATLASGSSDKTVKLWRVADGTELRTLTGHSKWVNSIAFSPDGQLLASGSWDETVKLLLVSVPERGLPPDLFADLEFSDADGDGVLSASETVKLKLTLSNRGAGPAHRLKIKVFDDKADPALSITTANITRLDPGASSEVELTLTSGMDLKTADHRLRIDVQEHFGYDMDPAYLVLQTRAFQPPQLVFSGLEVVDWGEGTYGRPEDGQLQAGEQARLKIVVQNAGQRTADETRFVVASKDPDIYITGAEGELGTLESGAVKEFWLTISPNKRVATTGNLPVYMSLFESTGKGGLTAFQLPLSLNQKPAEPNILAIKPDIDQLKREIARFEYTSPKFTARVSETSSLRPVLPASIKRPNSVAVVIGIEKYRSLPAAPYAESDAELMKEYLAKRLGVEQVVLYKSNEATGLFFDNVFNPYYGELQRAVVKGKTEVFVYYSGHGIPAKDGSAVYLFPSDGRSEQLDKAGYNLNTLYENLNQLGAKSVTVILDACFSGAARPSEKIAVETLVAYKAVGLRITEPWKFYPNFTVINSSALDETSLGYDQSQTGLFTYYLALGLQGKADANGDHKLTLGELKQYVTDNVMETSRKISGLQTPQFHGDENRVLVQW